MLVHLFAALVVEWLHFTCFYYAYFYLNGSMVLIIFH